MQSKLDGFVWLQAGVGHDAGPLPRPAARRQGQPRRVCTQSLLCRAADRLPSLAVIWDGETLSTRTAPHCTAGTDVYQSIFVSKFCVMSVASNY